MPHSKTIKNTNKLLVFGKNDSPRLSLIIFLELTIKLNTGIFDLQK